MLSAPTLLDAAMGTALAARGLPSEALPEEWILARPQEIATVHAAHVAAGARVLLTCTFNCTPSRLEPHGLERRLEALCGCSERLARSAGRAALVAGCVGPTGLSRPGRRGPQASELREQFARPFCALRDAGVDLLWTETHYALDEALAALAEARRTGLPVVVTMALAESSGGLATPDGAPADECLRALAANGAAAVGVNCVLPSPALAETVRALARDLEVPIAVKPNAGPQGAPLDPEAFAAAIAPAVRAGARLAGGCCGTTADHLRALRGILMSA